MLYGSTLDRSDPVLPRLCSCRSWWAASESASSRWSCRCARSPGSGPREIGPVSAITLMVQNLGGPAGAGGHQAVQTSRTLYLGGTTGPVEEHDAQPARRARTPATPTHCCGSPASRSWSASRRSGSVSPHGRSRPHNTRARRSRPASWKKTSKKTTCRSADFVAARMSHFRREHRPRQIRAKRRHPARLPGNGRG